MTDNRLSFMHRLSIALGFSERVDLVELSILSKDNHWKFQLDSKDRLYWNGRLVRTGYINVAQTLAIAASIAAILVAADRLGFLPDDLAPESHTESQIPDGNGVTTPVQ